MPYDFSTWDRNCLEEQATPISGDVSGSIPAWLRGSIILNGPGRMSFGDQEYLHVFDGQSLLQKITFAETGPVYQSKYLRSNSFLVNSESNQIAVSELGTKGTPVTNKKKLSDKFNLDKLLSDNAPISVIRYGPNIYAVSETPFIHQIDPNTLDTNEKVDLHKDIGATCLCPHPFTLSDGSTINIVNEVGASGPRYDIYKFPPQPPAGKSHVFCKSAKIGSVDARWKLNPCFMHSFGLTEKSIVIVEQPLTMDVKVLLTNTVLDKPFIEGMEWVKNKMVKFHVVSLETGKEMKVRFKSDAFSFLHVVNSFEEDNHVILDICGFTKNDILYQLFLKEIREKGHEFHKIMDNGKIIRFVIPLSVNEKAAPEENQVTLSGSKATAHRQKDGVVKLTPETLSEMGYENPQVNPSVVSKKYNYFYGASADMSDTAGKVGKVDVRSGEVKLWSHENLYACTLNFIPRPGSTAEDDGVILVTCLHGGDDKQKMSMAILDANSMSETGVVTFSIPSQATRALHGLFLPA